MNVCEWQVRDGATAVARRVLSSGRWSGSLIHPPAYHKHRAICLGKRTRTLWHISTVVLKSPLYSAFLE